MRKAANTFHFLLSITTWRHLLLVFLLLPVAAAAQQLEIIGLEHAIRDNTAWNTNTCRKLDDGRYCPVVKVRINQSDLVFEGNLIGEPVFKTNEYWVYMNPGSYHLIVKHAEHELLDVIFRDHMDDAKLKERCTYVLTLRSKNLKRHERLDKGFHVFVGGSYQLIGFSGPAAHIGFSYGPLYAEGSFALGTNKMDNVTIYRSVGASTSVYEAYNYKAKHNISARIGAIIDLEYLLLTPFVGYSQTTIEGESIVNMAKTDKFKKLQPAAAIGGVRVSFPIGKIAQVHVTPQYVLGLDNDEYFKVVSSGASDMESWAKGFQVSGGIMFRF